MQFKQFRDAVAVQLQKMSATTLFWADISKDDLWTTYLNAFPAGSDPLFRERTEHDCNCCKQFIRAVGNVVSVMDGKLVSIWDIDGSMEDLITSPYTVVASRMAERVKIGGIENIFLHTEQTAGTSESRDSSGDSIVTWNHFFAPIPAFCIVSADKIGPMESDARSSFDVFLRGLETITVDALDTVIELSEQKTLYKGMEFLAIVTDFRRYKIAFDKIKARKTQQFYAWDISRKVGGALARIRNAAIGGLLVDLSEGMELQDAVDKYGKTVDPLNYKRTTSLVTKAQIAKAQVTIEELGLGSALQRRLAHLEDFSINNVLFANREAKKAMNVFDSIAAGVTEKLPSMDKMEEISITDFINNVIPRANSISVLLENRLEGNLVSMTAPEDPDSKNLFKWDNRFAWSYNGDVTDSIKERVKRAGGKVEGDLCCRLAWDYTDDLDFHMREPRGSRIWYGNRNSISPCGGMLDVDANGGSGMMAEPVENIYYSDKRGMKTGVYSLSVNNYTRRSTGKGFEVEVDLEGTMYTFAYDKVLRSGETIQVAQIEYTSSGFKIIESLPATQTTKSKMVWGMPTQTFVKANVVMFSPNHWEGHGIGPKHTFFMLEGAEREGKARGFYNEFLRQDLDQHRKVLEIVGAKMKPEESDRQLSGLGFSETKRNHLIARTEGKVTRTFKINF